MPDTTEIALHQKFLLINPNTSEATTLKLYENLLPLLPVGFGLDVRTVSKGAPYIACEASHAVADPWGHAPAHTQREWFCGAFASFVAIHVEYG